VQTVRALTERDRRIRGGDWDAFIGKLGKTTRAERQESARMALLNQLHPKM
jgi:hypothetical protein